MKLLLSIVSLMLFLAMGIQAQEETKTKNEEVITTAKVEVYYFHNTRRCATCVAVEDVTLETLKESYPEQMKTGELTFASLDLEDNDAFLYARTKPEKLKEKINKVIGTI